MRTTCLRLKLLGPSKPKMDFPICPAGACVSAGHQDAGDRMDMLRGFHRPVRWGSVIRATQKICAGERVGSDGGRLRILP